MKRYRYPFSVFGWFHARGIGTYHGCTRGEGALISNKLFAEYSTSSTLYSNGVVGLNRVPSNFDDFDSVRAGEVSQNANNFNELGHAKGGSSSESFGPSNEHFQHQSSPRNHYTVNDWKSSQNHCHHAMENFKANPNNPSYSSGGNVATFQQTATCNWTSNNDLGYPYKGNTVTGHPGGYQHEIQDVISNSNGYQVNPNPHVGSRSGYYTSQPDPQQQNFFGSHNPWGTTQSPLSYQHEKQDALSNSNGYQVNPNSHAGSPSGYYNSQPAPLQQNFIGSRNPRRIAQSPLSYQLEKQDTLSNSNGYQVNPNSHAGSPSGYYNSQPAPQQQNSIGSHNPRGFSQSPLSPSPVGHLAETDGDDDKSVEGTLEELDALCKEWDLEKAVKSMRKMGRKGIHIDLPRCLTLMKACGDAKALEETKAVYQFLITFMSPVKVSTFNRVLEMYGKCGLMADALNIFNQMPERNLTSWDTMIMWFARNGLGEDAIDMFTRFKEAGLKPDGQMFFGVFDACGVIGDVTEGMLHFDTMSKIYGISPSIAHYARIVHMFGSAGYLDGALDFIEKMPVEPSVDVWETLMNVARVQGNLELGDRCAQIVEQLDPSCLSDESKAGLLPVKASETLKKKVKKANPLEHTKHEYRAGDRSHPENDKIYTVLRGIKESLKEAGYIPETRFVLHDIDQESKEEAIMAHSERLACTYALITSSARTPIRIIKNLRVCGDCHNTFKIISKLVGRQVIMRDAKRFHHFEDGKCSCNDYW